MIMAGVLSLLSATSTFAGWEQNEVGYYFMYENGTYPHSGIRNINGKNYAFDANGYMLTGWQYISFRWYYFEPTNGEQVYGWRMVDGIWYYLDPENTGIMVTYWKTIDGKRYYFDESGAMAIGRFYLSNDTSGSAFAYQTDETGALYRDVVITQGSVEYQFSEDGIVMYRNQTTRIVADELEDGDAWQYLYQGEGTDFKLQNEENAMYVNRAQIRAKNDGYQDYRKNVLGRTGTTLQDCYAKWEREIREDLAEKLVPEEEIQPYIDSVVNGYYYEVQIEEKGSFQTLEEYYGYDNAYDDEYDENYY